MLAGLWFPETGTTTENVPAPVGRSRPNTVDIGPADRPEFVVAQPSTEARGSTDAVDMLTSAYRVSLPDGFGVDPDALLIAAPVTPANRASSIPVTGTPRPGAEPAPILAPRPLETTAPVGTEISAPKGSPPLIPRGKGGGGITPSYVGPDISLGADTLYIPVNANITSKSPWKKDAAGADLKGLPQVRDFDLSPMRDLTGWGGVGAPPAGPAIADPDLKKMTATVVNGDPIGLIKVEVIYTNANSGQIRLWTDQTKTTEITSGAYLANYPVANFYVEGTRPSQAQNDIAVKVTYTGEEMSRVDQVPLTVTPVVDEFSVTPKDPATVTFLKTVGGAIYGISSGEQADGAAEGAAKAGVKYTADLNVRGIAGEGFFLQNVTDLTHAAPAVLLTDGKKYNPSFGTATFPMLDWVAPPLGAPKPFYATAPGFVYDSNRKMIVSLDTPALGDITLFASKISSMDATFKARMYVVWKYPDDTIYTLARADWQAVFKAATDPVAGLQLLPASVVTASPKVFSNVDPGTISDPSYNSIVKGAGFWAPA